MSDFFNSGWLFFVIILMVVGLVGCLWLLFVVVCCKVMVNDNSIGYVWDEDLCEFNNLLLCWWMIFFVLIIFCGGVYFFLYLGLGSNVGSFGWISRNVYESEQKKVEVVMVVVYVCYVLLLVDVLVKDSMVMGIGE